MVGVVDDGLWGIVLCNFFFLYLWSYQCALVGATYTSLASSAQSIWPFGVYDTVMARDRALPRLAHSARSVVSHCGNFHDRTPIPFTCFEKIKKNAERNYLERSASTHCGDGHVGGGTGTFSRFTPLVVRKATEDTFPEPGIDS